MLWLPCIWKAHSIVQNRGATGCCRSDLSGRRATLHLSNASVQRHRWAARFLVGRPTRFSVHRKRIFQASTKEDVATAEETAVHASKEGSVWGPSGISVHIVHKTDSASASRGQHVRTKRPATQSLLSTMDDEALTRLLHTMHIQVPPHASGSDSHESVTSSGERLGADGAPHGSQNPQSQSDVSPSQDGSDPALAAAAPETEPPGKGPSSPPDSVSPSAPPQQARFAETVVELLTALYSQKNAAAGQSGKVQAATPLLPPQLRSLYFAALGCTLAASWLTAQGSLARILVAVTGGLAALQSWLCYEAWRTGRVQRAATAIAAVVAGSLAVLMRSALSGPSNWAPACFAISSLLSAFLVYTLSSGAVPAATATPTEAFTNESGGGGPGPAAAGTPLVLQSMADFDPSLPMGQAVQEAIVQELDAQLASAVDRALTDSSVTFDVRANVNTLLAITGVIFYWRGVWTLWDVVLGYSIPSEFGAIVTGLAILGFIRRSNLPLAEGFPSG